MLFRSLRNLEEHAKMRVDKGKIISGDFLKEKIFDVKKELDLLENKKKLASDFEILNNLYEYEKIKKDELNLLFKMYK